MSVAVLFSFSTGLARDIVVPAGTLAHVRRHVADVEEALGIEPKRYKENPAHWTKPSWDDLDKDAACQAVDHHNKWVRRFYDDLARWSREPPSGDVEMITPAQADGFWHGLQTLEVPTEHWSREHFVTRMEEAYEVMRGRPSGCLTWPGGPGGKPLTPRQAANVLWLLSQIGYDPHDMRLDVPRGHDHIASSYDGGYEWCETCGAVTAEDGGACRRRGCALRKQWRDEEAELDRFDTHPDAAPRAGRTGG